MSQQTTHAEQRPDAEQAAETLVDWLQTARFGIGATTDVSELPDEQLVELWTELKDLADAVEDLRKDVVEPVMEQRVDPGERLLGINRIESHNKYVAEDDGAVVARAVSQGIDYTEFVSVNASTLASEHPDLAEIGEASYTYFR
jgi:hypothetical protein